VAVLLHVEVLVVINQEWLSCELFQRFM